MNFDEKYQLLDLTEDGSSKTFIAREIRTGREVTVFLFVGEQAVAHAEVIQILHRVDRSQFPELIEIGSNRGTPYVVTEPLSGFSELKQRASLLKTAPPNPSERKRDDFSKVGMWRIPTALSSSPDALRQGSIETTREATQKPIAGEGQEATSPEANEKAASGASVLEVPEPSAPGQAVPAPPSVGEFTQMFQPPAAPVGEPTQGVAGPAAAKPPEPAPMVQPEAGEFTRLFQSPAEPAGEPSQTAVPPAAATAAGSAAAAPPAAGEFTRMFESPTTPLGEPAQAEVPSRPAEAPESAAKVQSEPGEFTRFFQSAPPAAPPVSAPPKSAVQGEFTQIFGGSSPASTPPQTVTRIFESPLSAASSPREDAAAGSSSMPPSSYNAPAGEFTRIFGGGSLEAPEQAAASGAPSASPAAGEYTRMFGSQPPAQTPAAKPVAVPRTSGGPEPSPQAKQMPKLTLVLIGIVLLLLATIAVLVVAMKQ